MIDQKDNDKSAVDQFRSRATMFMDDAELAAFTGYEKAKKQIDWLKINRIPHLIGGDGKPKVVRDTVLAILGPSKSTPKGPQLRFG